MSNSLSPAQALSIDVLRLIMKWVTQENKSSSTGVSCEVHYLKELLTVSSAWRQVALEFLWRQVSFTINDNKGEVQLKRPKWVENNALPHNAANFVKKIIVYVSMSAVVSGMAHKLLVNYIGHTKLFPLANKLTLSIEECTSYHVDDKDLAIANALEFANLLKSMALSLTMIELECCGDEWQVTTHDLDSNLSEEILATFASVVYASTKRAHLNLRAIDIETLAIINSIPPLSWLTLDYTESSDIRTSLVHKSASTLQYLDIPMDAANVLLYNFNGKALVYPNMQGLILSSCFRNRSNERIVSSAGTPFPVLSMLSLFAPYPFEDDVLFRGNATTLKSLSLHLDGNTIATLSRERVFENKHRVLQNIYINKYSGDWNTSINSNVNTERFFNHLARTAKRFAVTDLELNRSLLSAIKCGKGFQNIKVINFCMTLVSIFDVLSTLKPLPALVELFCGISGLGPELEDIAVEELPNHVASTYSDNGKNFQVWTTGCHSSRFADRLVDYALLLALASPKLHQIIVVGNALLDYDAKVSKALESGPYAKYALQLNRMKKAIRE